MKPWEKIAWLAMMTLSVYLAYREFRDFSEEPFLHSINLVFLVVAMMACYNRLSGKDVIMRKFWGYLFIAAFIYAVILIIIVDRVRTIDNMAATFSVLAYMGYLWPRGILDKNQ